MLGQAGGGSAFIGCCNSKFPNAKGAWYCKRKNLSTSGGNRARSYQRVGTPAFPGDAAGDMIALSWRIWTGKSAIPECYSAANLTCLPSDTGQAIHSCASAATSASIWASVWVGPGVRRSRSVPRGTVG